MTQQKYFLVKCDLFLTIKRYHVILSWSARFNKNTNQYLLIYVNSPFGKYMRHLIDLICEHVNTHYIMNLKPLNHHKKQSSKPILAKLLIDIPQHYIIIDLSSLMTRTRLIQSISDLRFPSKIP